MSSKAKIWLWVGVAVLLGLIVVINMPAIKALFKGKAKGKLLPAKTTANNVVGTKSTGGGYTGYTAGNLNACLQLSQGSTGPEVKELQTMLNAFDSTLNLTVDGVFGTDTNNALLSTYGDYYINLLTAWGYYTDADMPYLSQISCTVSNVAGTLNYGSSNQAAPAAPVAATSTDASTQYVQFTQ